MIAEEKTLTELAAVERYPHNGEAYFNSVQNSRRGDFCDGAVWFATHAKPLWPRMYEALSKVLQSYEPDDKEDQELFKEIEEVLNEAQKIKITVKKFDKPTYPIKKVTGMV